MEVSALRYSGGIGLHGRSPLLRLQSDERLITLVRRGNPGAFEILVSRYQSRLLAFCRHLLSSREDAEDVLQEVLTAAYNAMVADEREINVRPWLYRIARNRCLNHLRRVQAVGVDSMDVHLSDFGASTADKVHMAEEFRLLVDDIQDLPETQRTALVLREMDALSYDQIAEAMETTVPSVKSLLVRARLSLAEASEARLLSCEQVRIELAEVAEGLLPKSSAPVRRHLRSCKRCNAFQGELKRTSKALAALLPLGPLALLKQLAFVHIGHSAGAGSSASGAGAAGTSAAVGSGAAAGSAVVGAGAGGLMPLGIGAVATKAVAGLAAAALFTAGAVEVSGSGHAHHHRLPATEAESAAPSAVTYERPGKPARVAETSTAHPASVPHAPRAAAVETPAKPATQKSVDKSTTTKTSTTPTATKSTPTATATATATDRGHHAHTPTKSVAPPATGTTQTESVPTVLSAGAGETTTGSSDQMSSPVESQPSSSSSDSSSSSSSSTTGTGSSPAPAGSASDPGTGDSSTGDASGGGDTTGSASDPTPTSGTDGSGPSADQSSGS